MFRQIAEIDFFDGVKVEFHGSVSLRKTLNEYQN